MDLGRARLRKVGINNLHCAVHPQHGVVWTDGKSIYLAPIQVEGHHVRNAESVKLGEFEYVASVKWSSATNGESCHLCVIHQQNVTVWRVSGALPKLSFKQVRKINVRPVPQGCLWNPCSDVLCLLSHHQCSFYFRHDTNKGSYAFPALESGSITCGCWSPDGTKLVLCVGAALLIYRWSDVNAAVDDFSATAWRIPGLEGKLISIAPVRKDSVVVAAEIPLENLCKQQDLFRVPDSYGDGQVSNSDGIIRPSKSASVTESLLNLQQNAQAVAEPSSSLTLVHLPDGSHDPVKLSTVPLKGVIAPDILMYEKSSQCVVVGSNSQSQLHIYALLEKHLAFCGNIQLDKGQRPKGLCSMPAHFDERGAALLILVGQREVEETGLMSPSTESEFKLSLKYIILRAGHNHRMKHNRSSDSWKERSGHMKSSHLAIPGRVKSHHVKQLSDPNIKEWSDLEKNDHRVLSHTHSAEAEVKLPGSSTDESLLESEELLTQPQFDSHNNEKMIEDLSRDATPPSNLEVDRVPFSALSPSFNNEKLNATYQLSPVSDVRSGDQTDSPRDSTPQDIIGREAVEGCEKLSTVQTLSMSKPVQSQPLMRKSSSTEHVLEEPWLPQSRESQPGAVASEPECLEMSASLSSAVGHPGGTLLRTSPTSTRAESPVLPSPESGIILQSSSCSSQTEGKSPEYCPSTQTDVLLQTSSSSSQTDIESPENLSSLHGVKIQTTSSSSQTDMKSTKHLSSLHDVSVQTASISSQTERDSTECLSSLHVVNIQTTATSSQTDGESTKHLSSLQSDTLQTTSDSSQTDAESLKHFSSLQTGITEARADLSELSHPLRIHEVDHAKEDTFSDIGLGSSQHSMDSSWEVIEKQVKSQKDSIDALYRRLESLSITVDKTCCVFPTKYQDMNNPEMVEIYCEKSEGTMTKRFLLDNGRLQLEPVKLAFGLSTVELWLDGISCVLGANIDGYIPLKFSPSAKLHISGRPADRHSES